MNEMNYFIKENNEQALEYHRILSFLNELKRLLKSDKYIAKRDYKYLIETYKDEATFFEMMEKAELISVYCEKLKLDENKINSFLQLYSSINGEQIKSKIIEEHNWKFLNIHLEEEKKYLDNLLKEVDPMISLDREQRKVILSDEDYTLVVAGAGAGKTTTLAGKVKYLTERKKINPKEILVISFTNKAVNELKEKINKELGIECPITTFHATGYAVLKKTDLEKKVINEGFLYNIVNDYIKNKVVTKPILVEKLIQFFGNYFDLPYEGKDINLFFNFIASKDYSTLKSNIGEYNQTIIDYKTGKNQTLNNEIVRSIEEVQIANFLYLNGLEYEYEPIYPYHILKAKKPYTPDFKIRQGDKEVYLEHFGITEDGHHTFYSEQELETYKKNIQDKIELHKKHKTKLIYTFSAYKDNQNYLKHLEEELIKCGFELQKVEAKEVFLKLVTREENKYITKFVKLMCTFLSNFKTNGYTLDDLENMQRNANVRSKLFFDIFKECYLEYQRALFENEALDFQDMINDSARILKEKQIKKETLDFKYIIVDEYQDISRQRFNLTKELSKLCDAKIIAVGDDWQSIFAFSGSDISLFTKFTESFPDAKVLKITKTYRNAQEIIDIAGNFIQKNKSQIQKTLLSPKTITKPVIISTYNDQVDRNLTKGKGGKYYNLGKILEKQIGFILEKNKEEGKSILSTILILGRYNFDARNMCFSKDFNYDEKNGKVTSKKYPTAKLEFMTAHSSKGLGYDNVIIMNTKNETYGFPSKVENDLVLNYVTKQDNSIQYAEERRLFYVALTRTKNRVFILTPENNPSEFVLELIKDYSNITLNGNLNSKSETNIGYIKKCPICGYPLQLRWKKNYGMRLWMCTNEPEICTFLTNKITILPFTIQKCDCCKDGYLIVKQAKNMPFLGCTNYKKDGSGCNRTLSYSAYEKWQNTNFEMDSSINKPSYHSVEEKNYIPLPNLKKTVITSKASDVHKTKFKKQTIKKDGFELIVDDEMNIITNIELLKKLQEKRLQLAKEKGIPAFTILNNRALVSLATYKPRTKNEFVSLYGLGEKTYSNYGMMFIKEIETFYAKEEVYNKENGGVKDYNCN